MTRKQRKTLSRIAAASLSLAVLSLADAFVEIGGVPFGRALSGIPDLLLHLAVYIVIGGDILRKAAHGALNGRMFDENFLMAVATVGAFALAVMERSGDYTEGIAVMLFYQIGEFFQSVAVGKSRRSIAELMDIRPDTANVERGGSLVQVPSGEVSVGTVITVRPGERIPIDGIVAEGESTLDTSALTGESRPRRAVPGDEVFSGSINSTGTLRIRTTKEFSESTATKILELVENSTSKKSKSEAFISKFARVYTPAVCLAALALAIVPPLVQSASGVRFVDADGFLLWRTWIYRALTFLVISCPCALVISIPLGFFAGIGGASREGVLVKGSVHLENLSKVTTVVFDKTGTLTEGVFEVVSVRGADGGEAARDAAVQMLEAAAHAESSSTHPVAKAIAAAYGKPVDASRVSKTVETAGKGVRAEVGGKAVAVGNASFMEEMGLSVPGTGGDGTVAHVAVDGVYTGSVLISDRLKGNSKAAVAALKRSGIKKAFMLTGDSEAAAVKVSRELSLDGAHSGLLPAGKVSKIEEIISAERGGGLVSFVGDGLNDAPVLARADVGIAMGAMGSDAAIEAADVVLMDDDPLKIAKAVRISRKCLGIVKENIVFALAVKGACLALGAFGIANMWLAVFADVGVMVVAVLNAVRALDVKKL